MREYPIAASLAHARLVRNYADAAQRMSETSGSDHQYHLGRQVAVAQCYAELFDLSWIEAEVRIKKAL